MPTPFPPNKTAEELGIDLKRTFVVVSRDSALIGERLRFISSYDPEPIYAWFTAESNGNRISFPWSLLAYADGPEPEAYVPAVGDRVSLEAEIVRVYTSDRPRCDVKLLLPNITLIIVPVEDLARAKLLSRKTRKLTKEEAHPSPTKTASV